MAARDGDAGTVCAARLAGASFGASVKLGRLERAHVIDIWDTDCS